MLLGMSPMVMSLFFLFDCTAETIFLASAGETKSLTEVVGFTWANEEFI
jgi:hypothetical protein